jgi:hypothetical protein
MRPKTAQTKVDSMSELTGSPNRGLTTFHHWYPGIPPSREKAHVHRDAAVRDPITANTQIPSTEHQYARSKSEWLKDALRKRSPRAAPADPVTVL